MKRVAIVGASGFSGHDLLKLIKAHPQLELGPLVARSEAGKRVSDLYPDWPGDEVYIPATPDELAAMDVDLMFLCLPNGQAMKIVPRLPRKMRVVDVSADYRFDNRMRWEQVYGMQHADPARQAVYGLTEWARREVAGARVLANPGCYVTASLMIALPLAREGVLSQAVFDCKSGYSGAGRKPSQFNDPEQLRDDILAYKLANHRHQDEISEKLGLEISFTPHVLPAFRGILCTAHLWTDPQMSAAQVRELVNETYHNEPFVKVLSDRLPTLHDTVNTNKVCIGGFEEDERTGRVVVVSTLDNLVKGAAGQALQNANLMLGLPETTGLR
ncbi:MAG: N-acetyl-gamma-glutamyl-phosphate reductase [Candidatus Alcyoniella australis]|nr:N-acetyl-gamma-glutamyl-phosphate reductase [Candidatus Alcyoniella australis]